MDAPFVLVQSCARFRPMAAAKQSESSERVASAEQSVESADVPTHAPPGPAAPPQASSKRYRLDALLGRGGMGEVWSGQHLVTGRLVAVKVLRNALVHQPDMRRRFLREARAAAAIQHPNVVEVLDAFELDDGTPALVMPLLDGETLGDLMTREGALGVATAVELLLPLLAAVDAAHQRGVVHRDLKPDNVFLEGDARVVKVLDFGIAKLVAEDSGADSAVTATGTLIGTPCYMAPEQALGERDQDHRVDIWALGVIAYEAISGCRPIEGENIGQIVKTLLTQATTPLEVVAPHVPSALSALVMRMLARDKAQRPASLGAVHAALSALELQAALPPAPLVSVVPRVSATASDASTLLSEGAEPRPKPTASPTPTSPSTGIDPVIQTSRVEPKRKRKLPLTLAAVSVALASSWSLLRSGNSPPHAGVFSVAPAPPAPPPPTLGISATAAIQPSIASATPAPSTSVTRVQPQPRSGQPSAEHAVAKAQPSAAPAIARAPSGAASIASTPPATPSAGPRPAPLRATGLQEDPPF
jgi:serine/threonine protein kinase